MRLFSIVNLIIKGDGDRPTRFHDEKGNLVTPGGYIYALHSLISNILRHSFGYQPPIPWLSYRAHRYIDGLLCPQWTVLEFGSHMTTAWFAHRCQLVYSVENDPDWYACVEARLSEERISNVSYSLRDEESYPDLSDFSDHYFDFVLIDGIRRTDCVRNAIPKLKPDGWIYLDNTDWRAKSKPGNDYQEAEKLLLSYIPSDIGFVKYFTDFVPTNFFAKQGMLVHFK